MLKYSYSLTLF